MGIRKKEGDDGGIGLLHAMLKTHPWLTHEETENNPFEPDAWSISNLSVIKMAAVDINSPWMQLQHAL